MYRELCCSERVCALQYVLTETVVAQWCILYELKSQLKNQSTVLYSSFVHVYTVYGIHRRMEAGRMDIRGYSRIPSPVHVYKLYGSYTGSNVKINII